MPKPTATATATGGGAVRRLSDLLQEQQEPFLQRHSAPAAPHQRRRYSLAEACGRRLRRLLCDRRDRPGRGAGAATALGRTLLLRLLCGGSNAAAKPLQRWCRLAGCIPCAGHRFRRLPRAGAGDVPDCCDAAMVDGGSTQLSPVSVLDLELELELRSDGDESPDHWGQEQDDGGKPTKKMASAPSPPPSNLGLTAGAHPNAVVGTGGDQKQRGAFSLSLPDKEQAVVSAWERIAADISRIPTLVALDLSGSGPVRDDDWRRRHDRLAGEEEARRLVGQGIEAMIFEEVRWEAVRDMILLHSTALTDISFPDFTL
ncbi:hypothetical protein BS78_08G167200 [Paspalum vaginatum]|nr:hypothetical protein BS78_08G167200 [Paspalum vaginatum]